MLALVNDVVSRCAICVVACCFDIPEMSREGTRVGGPMNQGGVNNGWMVWVNLANGARFECNWLGVHGWGLDG